MTAAEAKEHLDELFEKYVIATTAIVTGSAKESTRASIDFVKSFVLFKSRLMWDLEHPESNNISSQ